MAIHVSMETDALVIIESLPDGERHTGRNLYDTLRSTDNTVEGTNIPIVYKPLKCRKEFEEYLAELCQQENFHKPILHIETHGYTDKGESRITFADETSLSSSEIYDQISALNKKAHFNLIVSFAACYGIDMGNMCDEAINRKEQFPFFAIIGSRGEVKPSEIESFYSVFYKLYFDGPYRTDSGVVDATKIAKFFNNNKNSKFEIFTVVSLTVKTYSQCEKQMQTKFYNSNGCAIPNSDVLYSKATQKVLNKRIATHLGFDLQENRERFAEITYQNLKREFSRCVSSTVCDACQREI